MRPICNNYLFGQSKKGKTLWPLVPRSITPTILISTVLIVDIQQSAIRITSIISMTVIFIICTRIKLMSMSSKLVPPILCSVPLKRAAHTRTTRRADTNAFPMGIMSITS
jgi:hypothetical protein